MTKKIDEKWLAETEAHIKKYGNISVFGELALIDEVRRLREALAKYEPAILMPDGSAKPPKDGYAY